MERFALRGDAEAVQLRDRVWHQPFPACLVDGTDALFHDHHVKSGPRGVERGGQSGGTPTGNQQVDHWSPARAAFSTLIRVLNSTAFSTVNTDAVIQAVCTSGNAIPSTTTAT